MKWETKKKHTLTLMSFKSIQILRKGVVSGGDPATRWQGHHHSTNYVGLGLKTQFLPVLFVWRLDLNIQWFFSFFCHFQQAASVDCRQVSGHTHTHSMSVNYCILSVLVNSRGFLKFWYKPLHQFFKPFWVLNPQPAQYNILCCFYVVFMFPCC